MSKHLLGPVALSLAVAIPAHSVAAADAFLKLDGIDGESTDSKHKNEIEIASWSFGLAPRASATGQETSARPCISDISLSKHVDKSSPVLFAYGATGKHIGTAVLTVRKAGENPVEYLVVTMTDVIVSSVNSTAGGGGDSPVETVSFSYGTIGIKYTPQSSDGSSSQPVQTTSKSVC